MSRITKQIAELTAKSLVKEKKEKIKEKTVAFKEKVESLLLEQTPREVLNLFVKHPNYITTCNSVQISGNGWDFQTIVLNRSLPSDNNYRIQFVPDVETAAILLTKYKEIEESRKEVRELELDLSNAIFNLRTYKSVEENFPEAFLLLPKIVNHSLQINLSDIRNRINN